jgi:anti-sigma regulatory factor (Ser/Thr protein kinase)
VTRVWDVPVHDSTRVRDARVAAESAADHLGFDEARRAVAALVATELATNLLKHAGGGQILVDTVDAADTAPAPLGPGAAPGVRGPLPAGDQGRLVQIVALDHGPGIPDLPAALGDGWSTTHSLGAGLGTCLRVAHDFDVHSAPGRGTVALARIGAVARGRAPVPGARPAPAAVRAGGINIPFAAAEQSGDAWACVRAADRVTLLLADGLGHGAGAALASDAAVRRLRECAHLPPPELLGQLHTALRRTRGAAVAVAQVDLAAGELGFSGLGNIGARLRSGNDWRPLLSHPGIVGAHSPARLPHHRLPWTSDSVLVLHSDGLPSRWAPAADAVSAAQDPAVTAAVLVRDASSSARPARDDTTVAVLTGPPPKGP